MRNWDKYRWRAAGIVVFVFAIAALAMMAVSKPAKAEGVGTPSSIAGPVTSIGSGQWTGFYVGGHGGYGSGRHGGTGVYSDNSGSYNVLDPETGRIGLDGGIGGLQAGFNLQAGRLVYGIEGDFSWSGMNGEKTFISDDGNNGSTDYTWKIKTDIDWLATLRGRVGTLITSDLLIYGTGGVAFARVGSNETVVGFPPQGLNHETTVLASANENLFGWVVGAGAEWALSQRWTVKAEWQYLRFDDVRTHFKGTAYPERSTAFAYDQDSFPGDIEINTFRLGINYKLN